MRPGRPERSRQVDSLPARRWLIKPSEGRIESSGSLPGQGPSWLAQIGYLAQEHPSLPPAQRRRTARYGQAPKPRVG